MLSINPEASCKGGQTACRSAQPPKVSSRPVGIRQLYVFYMDPKYLGELDFTIIYPNIKHSNLCGSVML